MSDPADGKTQARLIGGLLLFIGFAFGLTYLWVRAATGGDTAEATDLAAAVTSIVFLFVGICLLMFGSES